MKRFTTAADSLDLLLGPMCNTFGVLVLVACITALFTQQSSNTAPARKITATEELLQRRLSVAEGEKTKLNDLIREGTQALTPEQIEKLAEVERLRQVLAALQQQTLDLDKTVARSASANAVDPGISIGELKKQQRTLQHDIDSSKNMIAALEEQLAHLAQRKEDLLKDKNKNLASRTVKMRFPLEHTTDLKVQQVIVRYGKVYPLYIAEGVANPEVTRITSDTDGYEAQPDSTAGWSIVNDKTKIQSYLASVDGTEFYFSIYVYPDSYETCRAFKQMIQEANRQFGIDALPKNFRLGFGKKGQPPPKPL